MENGISYQDLLKKHGSKRAAARAIGIPESTFRKRLKKEQSASALNRLGLKIIDAESAVIDGLDVKGTSRYYKLDDGGIWIKTDKEKESQQRLIDYALGAIQSEISPLKPIKEKPATESDLLALYVLSDLHLGMFAHKEESGEDWDLSIAEQTLYKWIDKAVNLSPMADTGVLLQLGDLLHTDSLDPVTPASKHVLDTGARFQKIVQVAINGIRYCISRMLEKHNSVHVILADANHDPTSSVWLRAMFSRLYENEPRVTIDITEHPYYCVEWGKASIFAHHGDKRGLNDVSKTFAALYRDVFGRTEYSYGHIGHYHHVKRRPYGDDGLMDMQIHPTLAPKDSYAARKGYISQRKAKTILYHRDHGYYGEYVVTPSMLL